MWRRLPVAFAVSLLSCDGVITNPDNSGPAGCSIPSSGPAPIRRLTRTEYNNTVRDLLGDTSKPGLAFPRDETVLGFDNNASTLSISSLLAEKYMESSETLAKNAVAHLSQLLPCDPAAGEDACVRQFIVSFGKRAWRRPLGGAEIDALAAVYAAGRMGTDVPTGVQLVIEAMLQSPHFLYRVEFGGGAPIAGTNMVPLGDYEMASRLSYFLWNS